MLLKKTEITLEQVRLILHISKRKAAWMLQNGIIPCRIRPCKTHRYIVRIEDLDEYRNRTETDRIREIPVGLFSSHSHVGERKRPELSLTVQGEEKERFINYLEQVLIENPERLTIGAVAKITGYSGTTVCRWIRTGQLYAVQLQRWLCIPKSQLVEFLAGEPAFMIRSKSEWHKNIIIEFMEDTVIYKWNIY